MLLSRPSWAPHAATNGMRSDCRAILMLLCTVVSKPPQHIMSCLQWWMRAATALMWQASQRPTTQRTPLSTASHQVRLFCPQLNCTLGWPQYCRTCTPPCLPVLCFSAKAPRLRFARFLANDFSTGMPLSPVLLKKTTSSLHCRRPDCVVQDRGHPAGQHGNDGGADPRSHHVSKLLFYLQCANMLWIGLSTPACEAAWRRWWGRPAGPSHQQAVSACGSPACAVVSLCVWKSGRLSVHLSSS